MFQKIPDTGLDYGGVLTQKQPVVKPEKIQHLALIGHETFWVRSKLIIFIKELKNEINKF